MNAVNLLPAKHRPRTPTGGQQGSAYAVVGVLGTLLVMVLMYVLTVNGINSRKDSVARAKAETAQAEGRARSLSAYGNFKQVKEQRVASVKQVATGRIDWERLARGLAHVLPDGVWLLSAAASASGPAQGAGPGAAATGGDAASGGEAGKPSLSLTGCARDHGDVADTLVRLKHLPNVEDVQLASVQRPDQQATSPGNPTGGGAEDCGTTRRKLNYKFDATVTFKANPGSQPTDKKVPASLGGGS